jgi:hypothetical protein
MSLHGVAGYDLIPTLATKPLSLISLGAGAGVTFELARFLDMSLSATGGYSLALYDAQLGGSPFLSADASLSFRLTPSISLGLGASYKHFFPTYQGLGVFLGSSFRLVAEKPKPKLQVPAIELLPVFPVFYKYYNDNPVGSVMLQNAEKKRITDVKVSFFVKSYMDNPKESLTIPGLGPGEEVRVPLLALFNTSILDVTQGTKAAVEVTIEYKLGSDPMSVTRVETLDILNRNALVWDDDRKAAAFVTELDPGVLKYAKNIAGPARDTGPPAVNAVFRQAMAIFESFSTYGLKYVIDPASSYAELSAKKTAVDYLQFPIQTLTYKAGDCDDLSILYCALLKSIGIESAFITVPGHIFSALGLPLSTEEARALFNSPEDMIFIDKTVWLPVETTMIDGGFLDAWRSGAKEWREAAAAGTAKLYPISKAWEAFPPTGFIQKDAQIDIPDAKLLQARYTAALDFFVKEEIQARVTALNTELRANKNDSNLFNKLGVLYARYGLLDLAEGQFAKGVARNHLPSMVNLGNLYLMRKEGKNAEALYARVLVKEPDNALALLGLARVNFESENYGAVKELYGRLAVKNPELAKKYDFLLSRQGQADQARASDVSARSEVSWSD